MDKDKKEKSLLDTIKEVNEAERNAAVAEEERIEEERRKRDEQRRRSYEEKLRQERVELMKRKQGLITEEEEKEPEPVREYTVWEKISNFFYHNKAYVILGTFFAALVIFLTYDYVTTDRPDVKTMFIATDYDMSYYCADLTDKWSMYAPDSNGDGEPMAKLYYVPATYDENDQATAYLAQSDRTKLFGEFQSGETIIVIGDRTAYEAIGVMDDVFADCRELFPDDPNAEELGYRLSGTDFKALIGYPEMDDSDLYVSFRKPVKTMGLSEEKMQKHFDDAVEFWKGFISEHRIDTAVQ